MTYSTKCSSICLTIAVQVNELETGISKPMLPLTKKDDNLSNELEPAISLAFSFLFVFIFLRVN